MKIDYNSFTTPDNLSIRYTVCHPSEYRSNGTIILLQGRAEFLEKYQETCEDLCSRNFQVFGMDWRGQGLSQQKPPSQWKGYVETYRSYLDDLNQFFFQIVRPAARPPYFILAHSMGAHISLRFLHENPTMIQKAVLVSPMIDIYLPFCTHRLIRACVFLLNWLQMGRCPVAGNRNYLSPDRYFSKNRLTSDLNRFERQAKLLKSNPDLDSGEITIGWLSATFRSIDRIRAPGFAEAIHTPILMFSAGLDRIISREAQSEYCKRMPDCTLDIIPDARHEILMETDAIRTRFWHRFDQFIT